MLADNFSLQNYLKKVGFAGEAKADSQTLTHMMACQLYSVPFENLDVQAGKIVSLVPEHIVDKIIHRKRGGYCYEVNGLFAMALQALGIDYTFVAARPMFYAVRRPKTHMAILAELNGEKWLCDLGFGSYGLREPFKITESESKQGSDSFRLSRPSERDYLLRLSKVSGRINTCSMITPTNGSILRPPIISTPLTPTPFLCRSHSSCYIAPKAERFYSGMFLKL